MALSGLNRGTGGNNTAATSIAIVPAQNFTAGTMAILAIAYDNTGASGADPFSSITDSSGNTWTMRQSPLNDPGAAAAGTVLRVYTTIVGTLGTGTTVTVSFSASTTAKAWTLTEISAAANFVPSYVQGSSNTGSTTTPSVTTGVLTSGNMIFAAFGAEGSSAITADSDTTNGTWSTQQTAVFGTTTAGMHVASQYKLLTAGGAQTYNLTLGATEDWAVAWLELTEISSISTSLDPMGMMGFFGI